MIQQTETTKLKIGFSALQILYWCAYGSTTTYIVSYMTAVRGASASLSGLLIAIFMLCACAGQFLVTAICDKRQNNRSVFALGLVICLVLFTALAVGAWYAAGQLQTYRANLLAEQRQEVEDRNAEKQAAYNAEKQAYL